MTDATRPFRQLARNNHLANRRLQRAVAALQPGEWEAPRTGFFPSLRATLNHIHVVDLYYLDAIAGGSLGPKAWATEEPYPDPSALGLAQTALDLQAIALCDRLTARDLDRPVHMQRADHIQTDTLSDTLLHLFLHSQHHRGQAHAMLSGTSVAPPQLDEFFMASEARFRNEDLSALGWTEADLR